MTTIEALQKIFNEDDVLYLAGTLREDGKGYNNPCVTRLADVAPQDFLVKEAPFNFFAINPISFRNNNIRADGTMGSYRASCNVVTFKNFLFESDALPLEIQRELIPVINEQVPLRLVTFSGGKSYHLIVSVADTLFPKRVSDPVMLYKQIWEGLCAELETICHKYINENTTVALEDEKIFDRATKDPARLSRLPMAIRADKGGTVQDVIHVGGMVIGDELMALATEGALKQYDGRNTSVDTSVDLALFEKKLRITSSLQFLRDRLEYPERWTSASNMYTEMFRYTLWCLDALQVPFPVLDAYFTKKVYPSILSKGYPRDPRAGVIAAYQFKGLL